MPYFVKTQVQGRVKSQLGDRAKYTRLMKKNLHAKEEINAMRFSKGHSALGFAGQVMASSFDYDNPNNLPSKFSQKQIAKQADGKNYIKIN